MLEWPVIVTPEESRQLDAWLTGQTTSILANPARPLDTQPPRAGQTSQEWRCPDPLTLLPWMDTIMPYLPIPARLLPSDQYENSFHPNPKLW